MPLQRRFMAFQKQQDQQPLRPITSSINCPTFQLSKVLAKILAPLQDNKYSVKNSMEFTERIASYSTGPDRLNNDVIRRYLTVHFYPYRFNFRNGLRKTQIQL